MCEISVGILVTETEYFSRGIQWQNKKKKKIANAFSKGEQPAA